MFQKLRREVATIQAKVGLESAKEISNYANEEKDVVASLKKMNVEYQEALKYLTKWQAITNDNEFKSLAQVLIDGGEKVKLPYDQYIDAYNNDYIAIINSIHSKHVNLSKLEKKHDDLEQKVKKGKGDAAQLQELEKQLNSERKTVEKETVTAYRQAITTLTKARVQFYRTQLEQAEQQLNALQAVPQAGAATTPVGQAPGQGPVGAVGGAGFVQQQQQPMQQQQQQQQPMQMQQQPVMGQAPGQPPIGAVGGAVPGQFQTAPSDVPPGPVGALNTGAPPAAPGQMQSTPSDVPPGPIGAINTGATPNEPPPAYDN